MAWSQQPKVTINILSKQLGLSQKRVSAAQKWATLGNLISHKEITAEGKLVLEKDPYLESTVTDWLLHFYLSLNGQGLQAQPENFSDWGIWTYIVYEFLPENSSFTEADLIRAVSRNFSEIDYRKVVKIFLEVYSQKASISNCGFLTLVEGKYLRGNTNLKNPYTIGYLLSTIWQRDFGSQESLLVSDLIRSPMGLSNVLGIGERQILEKLDHLAELEVVEQRSAKPRPIGQQPLRKQTDEDFYIVVRCWDSPLDLLAKAYDHDPAVPNSPLIQVLEGVLGEDEDEDFPFFLSSTSNWFLRLCPQQLQFLPESTSFNAPLHLAS